MVSQRLLGSRARSFGGVGLEKVEMVEVIFWCCVQQRRWQRREERDEIFGAVAKHMHE